MGHSSLEVEFISRGAPTSLAKWEACHPESHPAIPRLPIPWILTPFVYPLAPQRTGRGGTSPEQMWVWDRGSPVS